MKRKKFIKSALCFTIAFITVVTPISANEDSSNGETPDTYEITPFYWPGNPNPIPGSEAWLHEHGTKIPTGPKARECADKVVGNKCTWLAAGLGSSLTLLGFAKSFGLSAAVAWAECMYG